MLEKTPSSEPLHVDVTFTHPVSDGVSAVSVVGDFNGWAEAATPMTIDGGTARCTMTIAMGQALRFRYLVDGARWENDWQADAYAPNHFGGDDSVLDLTQAEVTEPVAPAPEGPKKPRKAAAPRKARST